MKLSANDALVAHVRTPGENQGENIVVFTVLKIQCDVHPRVLNQFTRKLLPLVFDKDVPTIPELGEMKWIPEYEGATFHLSSPRMEPLEFTDADVKRISFKPKAGFMVGLVLHVRVYADSEQRGVLTGLVKQKVTFALARMTQKVIEEGENENDDEDDQPPKDDNQQDLPGTTVTTDGKPIVPMLPAVETQH